MDICLFEQAIGAFLTFSSLEEAKGLYKGKGKRGRGDGKSFSNFFLSQLQFLKNMGKLYTGKQVLCGLIFIMSQMM